MGFLRKVYDTVNNRRRDISIDENPEFQKKLDEFRFLAQRIAESNYDSVNDVIDFSFSVKPE